MSQSSIPESLILSATKFTKNILVNKITININNTQSRNTLHHGRYVLGIGNKSVTPLPVTINRKETGSTKFKSTIKKAYGIVIYEIDDIYNGSLPLLLIVGWKISIIGKNKWFVFIGCETDPDFPDERSINEYLKENGNTGTNTLDFEAHSTTIDGSINDGFKLKEILTSEMIFQAIFLREYYDHNHLGLVSSSILHINAEKDKSSIHIERNSLFVIRL